MTDSAASRTTTSPSIEFGGDDEPLLVAAREEIVRHGLRRATVADIARRAEVSRVTVYRRLGDKDAIIRAVVTREISAFVPGALLGLADMAAEEQIVELFVAAVLEFQRNEVAQALLEYEPELLLELLDADRSGEMRAIRDATAALLTGVPFGGAQRLLEVALRLTATLLVAPSDVLPLETEEQARQFAEAILLNLLETARSWG